MEDDEGPTVIGTGSASTLTRLPMPKGTKKARPIGFRPPPPQPKPKPKDRL